MKLSSIGQRTECAMPKLLRYQESIHSIEKSKIRKTLHVLLDRKMLDERERHNAATGSIHSTPLDWQDLSLLARKCILDISGCIWACSVRVVVWSSRDDYCATGEYKP